MLDSLLGGRFVNTCREEPVRKVLLLVFLSTAPAAIRAQSCTGSAESLFTLTQPHDYAQ